VVIPRSSSERRWAGSWRREGPVSPMGALPLLGEAGAVAGPPGRWPGSGAPGETDKQMLVAAATGAPGAVRWLLDEVAPVVYGFVFARVGGDEAVAEDILQDTLLEAVRSAPTFRGESRASTWVCAIARRRLARHYETERRAEVARQSLRLVEKGVAEAAHARASEMVERQDEVVRALGKLPALQRQVLVLKYMEDMSVHDIAVQVNRSRVQVQSLLQRGRDGLRRQLGGQSGGRGA